jgi:enoyl-CoA hydratase/carnithine racemase
MGAIDLEIRAGVARITINNPARHNAMSLSMWQALAQTVAHVDDDAQVRALLLQGAGDKAFVSGADISEFGERRASEDAVAEYDRAVSAAQTALIQCGKPVVAAIRGVCYGGGMGLALACDLRYAAADARFRMPAGRLGLGYALGGMRRFVHTLGAARSAELFFTARAFDGLEAQRIGVAHASFLGTTLDAEVEAIVAMIAENAPLTLRASKLALRAILDDADAAGAAQVDRAVRDCFESEDYREGRLAFAEKRAPRFTGR